MTELMDVLLFLFLVITAFGIIRMRDLFAAVMMSGLFSLLSACLFMVMDAVDVAFTEAAVGAGISTVLMLATLAITKREERGDRRRVEPLPLLLCFAIGSLLIYGTLDMPAYGDPEAPVHTYMAPRFIEKSKAEVGPPNIVTSVLASYRGYDTFGETTVVFTALVGVLLLLGGRLRLRPSSTMDITMGVDLRAVKRRQAERRQAVVDPSAAGDDAAGDNGGAA
ncbi:MAG: DUF4040 domain-containing protein [Acidobacteriota bacterium]